jgi:hypothetical protein
MRRTGESAAASIVALSSLVEGRLGWRIARVRPTLQTGSVMLVFVWQCWNAPVSETSARS